MAIKSVHSYSFIDSITIYKKEILIGLCLLIGAAGALYAYKRHVLMRDRNAQVIFSECLTEYYKAMHDASDESWADIEKTFQRGYERSSSSSLAPYFLIFKADSLARQHKLSEALTLMDTILKQLPKDNSLKDLFILKYALMQIDSQETTIQAQGLQELEKIAHDTHNILRDNALYYLGLYYWTHDNIENAKKLWHTLIDEFSSEERTPSVWAQLAQIKLHSIE